MTGAIREVFKEVMRGAGRQGWLLGHMDVAARSIEVVLEDAKENLRRNPKHEVTHAVVEDLTKALSLIDGLSENLEKITAGEA